MRTEFAAVKQQHLNQIEALRYQTDSARQRFMVVNPQTPLVVATLNSERNLCLDELGQTITERNRSLTSSDLSI